MTLTVNDKIEYGKYKGMTVQQVLDKDPGWLGVQVDKGKVKLDEEADDALNHYIFWDDESYLGRFGY